jgi:hypothetical protein
MVDWNELHRQRGILASYYVRVWLRTGVELERGSFDLAATVADLHERKVGAH